MVIIIPRLRQDHLRTCCRLIAQHQRARDGTALRRIERFVHPLVWPLLLLHFCTFLGIRHDLLRRALVDIDIPGTVELLPVCRCHIVARAVMRRRNRIDDDAIVMHGEVLLQRAARMILIAHWDDPETIPMAIVAPDTSRREIVREIILLVNVAVRVFIAGHAHIIGLILQLFATAHLRLRRHESLAVSIVAMVKDLAVDAVHRAQLAELQRLARVVARDDIAVHTRVSPPNAVMVLHTQQARRIDEGKM